MNRRTAVRVLAISGLVLATMGDSTAQKGGTPPPNPAFAYSAYNGSGGGLYVMNADETNRRAILNRSDPVSSGDVAGIVGDMGSARACFSPAGDRLAFHANVWANNQVVARGLCTVNTTGAHGFTMIAKFLNPYTGLYDGQGGVSGIGNPSWSPANVLGLGEYIAYVDYLRPFSDPTRCRTLYVARPDGSESYPLFDPWSVWGEASFEDISWSPDGTRIAVTNGNSVLVFTLQVADGRLSADPLGVNVTPFGSRIFNGGKKHVAWANGQNKLAISATTDGVNDDIWVVEPGVLEPGYNWQGIPVLDEFGNPVMVPRATRLTATANVREYGPTWSPDDRTIYYGTGWFDALQRINADGSGRSSSLKTKGHFPNRRRF